jgi:superfamily II DNA/RNA helicase
MSTATQATPASASASTTRPSDVYTNDSDTPIKIYESFDEMGLPDDLLRGIYSMGFERPSPIQQRAIDPMIGGRDIIAQAQSGTGKTGTFTISALARMDPMLKAPQALVLCPTRELAKQSEAVAVGLSRYLGIKVHSATGGPPISDDIRAIQMGAQFIVGTPGRIYDLIRKNALRLHDMRIIVIDEADQMLEDRFREQLHSIFKHGFPKTCQVALLSATMAPEVTAVADELLNNPQKILLPPSSVTLDGIRQYVVNVDVDENKLEALCDIYKYLVINQMIIFVNKKPVAEWLATELQRRGFTLEYIHGELDMAERNKRMEGFRRGDVRVLISTDLLGRGIDVQQVSLVINFELPHEHANYIHRIGRSGRFGRKGVALNIISNKEVKMLEDIVAYYNTNIDDLPSDLSVLNA